VLQKEVLDLRERLANYNATVDNVRTQVELPEIRSRVRLSLCVSLCVVFVLMRGGQIASLKEQNAKKRAELEFVFTERSRCGHHHHHHHHH
jgi:hypothetical protein